MNRVPPLGCARILGIGGYRPSRIVGNDEICELIDSTDEWIRTRSGIASRRFAGTETVPEMAARAASKALSAAGLDPADVSCVVLASMSYLHQAPPAAAACAAELGAGHAAVLDVGAACAGFTSALAVANSLVRTGEATYVVVAGAERMSDIVNPRDRSTAFIFGDGAGAAILGPSAEPGIGPVVWGSATEHLGAIAQPESFARLREDGAISWPYLEMTGPVVFRWAIESLAAVARRAVQAAGIELAQLDAFIPHQANDRIIDRLVAQLKLSDRVAVAREVRELGNTSTASIPLAAERLLSAGELKPGALALTLGFGSGLNYSAQVLRLP